MTVNGDLLYQWRAADHEGKALEIFVTKVLDQRTELKLWNRALKWNDHTAELVTDLMRSYGAAPEDLEVSDLQ